jgi:hypothetical protein
MNERPRVLHVALVEALEHFARSAAAVIQEAVQTDAVRCCTSKGGVFQRGATTLIATMSAPGPRRVKAEVRATCHSVVGASRRNPRILGWAGRLLRSWTVPRASGTLFGKRTAA